MGGQQRMTNTSMGDIRLGRRELLRRGALFGLSVPVGAALLAACGGDGAPDLGTATTTTGSQGQGDTTPATATTETSEPEPTSPPERITVPEGKTDLVIAAGSDLTTPDPALSTGGTDASVHSNLYDHLVWRGPDGTLQPMLATKWEALDDTTWEFTLREGALFHHGEPVTSVDVQYSIERTRDPETKGSVVASNFATVESIETPDEGTVIFKTTSPDPLLPARLASFGGQILPKAYTEEVGMEGFAEKPIGAGPFKFVEWVKDDRVVLEAFAEYWDGAPTVETAIFKPRPETAARVSSLLSGEADMALIIMPDQFELINSSGTYRVATALYNGFYGLAVNSQVPVLSKPEIKQALSLGIDRQTIIDSFWQGQGIIPSGMIPEGSFAFDPSLPPLAYDPEEAKARLEAGGYDGEEIVIETTDGYLESDRQMAEAVVQMWQQIGINAKVELIEASVRSQKNRDKSFKGLWWTNPADTLGDPAGMAWRLLGPGGSQDYWRHERWDELGEEANSILDEEKRRQNYAEMNEIFLEHFPWIPILQPYRGWGVANYIEWEPYNKFDLRPNRLKFVE